MIKSTITSLRRGFSCSILILATSTVTAWAQPSTYSFGVIARLTKATSDVAQLRERITETDGDGLAFVVANGIKSSDEPCTNNLYERRKSILDDAKNGVILSLTANDWVDCKNPQGRSAAINRLTQLRDMFFADEFSFGASKIPVIRQSTTPKFRSYGENMRWEIGNVVYATINIPADNNHFVTDAGRNSEFEDRLIANKDWLLRLQLFASHKNMAGIVVFCDGNPMSEPASSGFFSLSRKRDGFAETRKMIAAIAAKYPGKILIVHGQSGVVGAMSNEIEWKKNIGELNVGDGWVKLNVNAGTSLFSVSREATQARN